MRTCTNNAEKERERNRVSSWKSMWSWVPYTSLSRRIVLLIFTNDMANYITTKVLKVVDDTNMFKKVNNTQAQNTETWI